MYLSNISEEYLLLRALFGAINTFSRYLLPPSLDCCVHSFYTNLADKPAILHLCWFNELIFRLYVQGNNIRMINVNKLIRRYGIMSILSVVVAVTPYDSQVMC